MLYLEHHSNCGMKYCFGEYGSREDARSDAAYVLRAYRAGYQVRTLGRGESWEILEPEDAVMVPDSCGTLRLRAELFECRECGCEYHDPDDAARCCTVMEFMDDTEVTE